MRPRAIHFLTVDMAMEELSMVGMTGSLERDPQVESILRR
jgi:hypothetical protein